MKKILSIKEPFLVITPVFISGIILAKYVYAFELFLLISIILVCTYLFLALRKKSTYFAEIILLTSLFLVAGIRFYSVSNILTHNHISTKKYDQITTVTGMVIESHFSEKDLNKYIIEVSSAYQNHELIQVQGKILLTTRKINQHFRYGDQITISGTIEHVPTARNPGLFDYRKYLTSKDIYGSIYITKSDSIQRLSSNNGNWFVHKIIVPLKEFAEITFTKNLNFKTASVLRALLLGEKQDIDRDIITEFQRVGVIHVLAISGLHVGFIILFVFTIFTLLRFPYNLKLMGLIIVLTIYVILINFKPPVMRASLMAVLILTARLRERKVFIYNIIFGAAFVILLFEPRELFNPGFQFSFMAVLSIIYGYQKFDSLIPLKKYLYKKYPSVTMVNLIIKWIWIPLLVSASAVLGTLPLTIYYYGLLPVFALFANIIVIPLVGIIVLLGIFLLLTEPVSNILAAGLGEIINLIYEVLLNIVNWFSTLPFAALELPNISLILVATIILIFLLVLNLRNKIVKKIIAPFSLILILIFITNFKNVNEKLEITFLDVGQGDAAFINFPNGKTMLIDAGENSPNWDQGAMTVLPFLKGKGIVHLNYFVGSHPHNDHIGGAITILSRIPVDTCIFSSYAYDSKTFNKILKLCTEKNIPIKYVTRGDRILADPACRIYVLHPDEEFATSENQDGAECNNSSVVLKIQYGDNGILFTGDLERQGEKPLLNFGDFLESEILKVGHHGSKTSTSQYLIDNVEPIAAIISVAKKNKFRHPSKITIQRLQESNIKRYLTSIEGAVVFEIGRQKITKLNWR